MQIARESCHFRRSLAIHFHLALIGTALALFASGPVLAQSPSGQVAEETPADPLAQEILLKADQIRFPKESFQVDINIISKQADQTTETKKYQVLSKGNDKTVVITTEPASERGQTLLMSGRDLWIFLPEVSQPVRLSLAQRLTGQVANGDLARANFSGDYHPRILRNETIDGESYHVLELRAVDRSVTYPRVLYWVNQKNAQPFKAEFYSLSNRLLKTCRYENFRNLAGKLRPTRLVMENALRAGEVSILEYNDMKIRELPDKFFTKEYLKKLD
ncbi:outer membrane lipoprotein-sorting protein [Sulfuricystis multivorans]|uniref:outer membrane lipoprotein-sorting protein n=1 Tax=Sulfuricystis multivorans TaxID=2211108 RepID=UPI000F81786D|nr:outer membrane lipoprotein-sorting protein [Sulfuricystis multivorans]